MQNGIGLILLAVVAMGAAGYYGYTQKDAVKMCDVPSYKVTKAEGSKVIQNGEASAPKALQVPCDELDKAKEPTGN
ncbi:MAG: hypothetical protein ABI459_03155 [Deltaproteobacteria bacterium]